ncbi:MAG TPA: DUF2100 domain-containing protein [Candidatus Methanofastidiosa archaeon]|nr:DUF2100 domain-containing protein [Candidatus Methanofastidiosa archaeon]HPR41511.1 DUF2100 domain-containing protein [Candidatus Methanofastidiosa archaeon]
MSELSVSKTYEAIYSLIDIQEIWRRTRPKHELSDEDKEELAGLIAKVRNAMDKIEGEAL